MKISNSKRFFLLIVVFGLLAGNLSAQVRLFNKKQKTERPAGDSLVISSAEVALSDFPSEGSIPDTAFPADTIVLADSLEEIPEMVLSLDSSHFVDDSLLSPYTYVSTNLDTLYYQWRKQGFVLYDESCEGLSDTVRVSDLVYLRRMMELPNLIPMTYNQIVRRFIELYAVQRRKQVSNMLAMSEYYFPIFEQALDANGLPQELKYLPIIESGLNANAVSKMGATGLWQFMYSTGKVYGLQINSLTDERRDPVKSTEAAMKFLKSLYGMFGDWNLAIAAYNCGPGNVRKAIARSGGKRDFWDIYYYLPRETRSYVPLFMAADYIMNYYDEHGICPAQSNFSMICDTFMIYRNMHFQQISEVCHIPMENIKWFNPQFRNNIAHGTQSRAGILYLPAEYTTTFINYQDSIPKYREKELLTANLTAAPAGRAGGEAIVYRVRSGDNLSTIAARHHVTVQKLKTWNNLRSDMLQIGQRLLIY